MTLMLWLIRVEDGGGAEWEWIEKNGLQRDNVKKKREEDDGRAVVSASAV